jgi:hypothetical protein
MYNDKWRLTVYESWEFKERTEMKEVLELLIAWEDKHGRLHKNGK